MQSITTPWYFIFQELRLACFQPPSPCLWHQAYHCPVPISLSLVPFMKIRFYTLKSDLRQSRGNPIKAAPAVSRSLRTPAVLKGLLKRPLPLDGRRGSKYNKQYKQLHSGAGKSLLCLTCSMMKKWNISFCQLRKLVINPSGTGIVRQTQQALTVLCGICLMQKKYQSFI